MEKYFIKAAETIQLRGFSKTTEESYLRRAKTFIEFTKKEPETLTMHDVKDFIKYLNFEKKLSSGTINAYLSGVKFFYESALEKEWSDKIVPRMRGYFPKPIVLSQEEVLEILASVNNIKHKAILYLMYGAGLRVSEVVRLRISDIDNKNMQIFISKSKNRHDRYAILPENCLYILREYWKSCKVKPKEWLFPGKSPNEHLNVKTIKNVMLDIKAKLNIRKSVSAHTLRHCFCTHLIEEDCQLPYVQQLMGHLSIKTTAKYVHLTSKAKMKIKSPLDKLLEEIKNDEPDKTNNTQEENTSANNPTDI